MADAKKKSVFDAPVFKSRIKTSGVSIWPEAALGYLVGPTLAVLCNSFMSTYINKYFTDVLQLNQVAGLFNTLLPLISVILVVIGNMFVGKLMDKGKSKAGKARPLILIGAPLILIAMLIMFGLTALVSNYTVTNGQASDSALVVWTCIAVSLGYNLFFSMAYPVYYTAHSTMVNLSTRDSSKRGLLGTISMATQLAAIGVCQMVFPFLIGFGWLQFNPNAASKTSITIIGMAFGIVACIGALFEFFFTRERITEETMNLAIPENEESKKPVVSTGKQFKTCIKDKYWLIIIAFWFLYQLGGMLKNNGQLYFCQAQWGTEIGANWSGTISILGAIPTSVGMVLAWPLSQKFGKGKTILGGAIVAALGGALGLIFASNPYVVVASFLIKALGSTPAMYLGLALTADMLDHQEAVNGFRCDGLTMSIYGAIMVGMAGVANGIINGCMSACNYSVDILANNAASSNVAWNTTMAWIFIGGETICYGAIALMFFFMNVEKFGKVDVKAIVADQRQAAKDAGVEFEEPEAKAAREAKENEEASIKAHREALESVAESKGLDVEAEMTKYLADLEAKKKAADDKKAAAAAKKAAKEAAIPEEVKKAKAEKAAKAFEEAVKDLNKARVAAGRSEFVPEVA